MSPRRKSGSFCLSKAMSRSPLIHQMEIHGMKLFCQRCLLAFAEENKTGLKKHRRSYLDNDKKYIIGGEKGGPMKPEGKLCEDCENVYALCNFNAYLNKFH